MGHYRHKEEQLRLGERAAYLRDMERLKWRVIAERLGVNDITQTMAYYKKYKISLLTAKADMSLGQIEEFSRRHRIERGWVWLYENGFRQRVPVDVQEKIEDAKLESW